MQASPGDAGGLKLDVHVTQTDYFGPTNLGQILDVFNLRPAGNNDVHFHGSGTDFPDLELVQGGRVEYTSDSQRIALAAVPPAVWHRSYDYDPPQ